MGAAIKPSKMAKIDAQLRTAPKIYPKFFLVTVIERTLLLYAFKAAVVGG